MPRSTACRKIGSAAASSRTHPSPPSEVPKLMHPSATRLTFSPDVPSRVYSMSASLLPRSTRSLGGFLRPCPRPRHLDVRAALPPGPLRAHLAGGPEQVRQVAVQERVDAGLRGVHGHVHGGA